MMSTILVAMLVGATGVQEERLWLRQLEAHAIQVTQGRRIGKPDLPPSQKTKLSEEEFIERLFAARHTATGLSEQALARNDVEGALAALLGYLEDYPKDEGVRTQIADICFERRRWDLMYLVLAPEVGWLSSPGALHRASYASAIRGQVFDGQRTFAESGIMARIGAYREDLDGVISNEETAQNVALLSMLAIGLEEFHHGSLGEATAELYMTRALELDPSNPIAAYVLGNIYIRHGRNIQTVTALEKGIPRAEGRMKKQMERLLAKAKKAPSTSTGSSIIGGG